MFKKHASIYIVAAVIGFGFTPLVLITEAARAIPEAVQGIVTQDLEAAGYFQLGVNRYNDRDLDAAAVSFRKALERDPRISVAHYYLANIFNEKGRTGEAIAEYQQAISMNPNLEEAHYNLGVIYDRQGQVQDALAAYDRTLGINPENANAYYNLGVIYDRLGQLDEASGK